MKKYLRFGEIPIGGRSINFLKLTNDQSDWISELLREGEVEYAFEQVPKYAFEPGVSVFELDNDNRPIMDNLRMFHSFCSRLDGKKDTDGREEGLRTVYIVKGKEIGRGNDGEPLLSDVQILRQIDYDPEWLLQFAIEELKGKFESAEFTKRTSDSRKIHEFFIDKKVNRNTGERVEWFAETSGDNWERIQYMEYHLAGWIFRDPVEGFDCGK